MSRRALQTLELVQGDRKVRLQIFFYLTKILSFRRCCRVQVAGHAAMAHEQIEALRQSYKEKKGEATNIFYLTKILSFRRCCRVQVAGHAAMAHEQIEALRQSYKEKFRDDPFAAAKRRSAARS